MANNDVRHLLDMLYEMIDGAKNAAILAIQIMAVSDEGLAHKLQAARDEGTAAVLKADEELRERYKN